MHTTVCQWSKTGSEWHCGQLPHNPINQTPPPHGRTALSTTCALFPFVFTHRRRFCPPPVAYLDHSALRTLPHCRPRVPLTRNMPAHPLPRPTTGFERAAWLGVDAVLCCGVTCLWRCVCLQEAALPSTADSGTMGKHVVIADDGIVWIRGSGVSV